MSVVICMLCKSFIKTKQKSKSNKKINNTAGTRMQINHRKNTFRVKKGPCTCCYFTRAKFLHITTKPRIHATNNTTLFDVQSIYNNSVINQSLQIEIGIQCADNISKISRNYSQIFKQNASSMLKKWDLHINKGTTEEFTINRYNNVKYCEAFLTTVNL